MADQVRRIIVKFDTQGNKTLEDIKKSLSGMNKSLKDTSSSLASLQAGFTTLFGASIFGFGIREIVTLADSMQKLNDRLVNTEGSSLKAATTLGKLRDIANATNSGVEDLAKVYTRLNLSLGDTGIETDGLLGLTLALQQSFRVSGATAEEANGAIVQLSQGLASGQLRGQELRSVLEANAVIGEILAKQFGKTRGELLKFAEKNGGIKAKDFLEALSKSFDDLNKRAATLKPTIGESLTKALNDLKVSFNELNKELGGTEKAVAAIEFTAKNLDLVLVGLGVSVAALLAYFKGGAIIGAFTTALVALKSVLASIAIGATVLLSPLYATPVIIGTVIASIVALTGYLVGFDKIIKSVGETLVSVFPSMRNFAESIGLVNERIDPERMKVFSQQAKNLIDTIKGDGKGGPLGILGDFKPQEAADGFRIYGDALKKAASQIKVAVEDISVKKRIELLNEAFGEGKVSVQDYNKQLLELTKLLNAKKGPTFQADALAKVLRDNLNREFEYGVITVDEFNKKLKQLDIEETNRKFRQGRITVYEYRKSLLELSEDFQPGGALYVGTKDFLDSIGTISQNTASFVKSTFSTLEDSLVQFTTKGKFSFKQFTLAILEDLNRVILRALVLRPLAQGVLGAIPLGGGTGNIDTTGPRPIERYAKGGAFSGGVEFFASGGVVNSPTAFGMSRGRTGVMGEAGPEAILPLKRGSDGSLGVTSSGSGVVVNIINQSGAQVQQTESEGPNGERVINVLVARAVKDGIARGEFDTAFRTAYGVTRKGV